MESQFLENTDIKITCHDADKCAGQYCTIHKRSNHAMRSFPQMWRDDRGFMERICPHGVGHPDPDEVYLKSKWDWSHACDGCCADKHEPECIRVVTKIYSIDDPCPLCTMVRKAYKRGREDAAKAIRRVPVQQIEEALLMFYWPAIAAAIDGDLE